MHTRQSIFPNPKSIEKKKKKKNNLNFQSFKKMGMGGGEREAGVPILLTVCLHYVVKLLNVS